MKINEAINISKKVASKLKELEGVKAVSIYGSIAKGIFDKYSDIDIMCFCEKIPNEGKRIEKVLELEGFVKRKKGWSMQDPFLYGGIHLTIEYENLKETKQQLRSLQNTGKILRCDDADKLRAHVINSKVLYDPKGEIRNIKDGLKPLIKKLPSSGKSYLKWIKYSSWKIEGERSPVRMAIKRKNLILANQLIDKTIEGLIAVVYMLNGEYYYDPKWIKQDVGMFKKKPMNFVKKIEEIYSTSGSLAGVNKKIKLVTSLIDEIEVLK